MDLETLQDFQKAFDAFRNENKDLIEQCGYTDELDNFKILIENDILSAQDCAGPSDYETVAAQNRLGHEQYGLDRGRS